MQVTAARSKTNNQHEIKWSDLDKFKFFGFGTVLYSALTLVLHPITVLKTRRQVLNNASFFPLQPTPSVIQQQSSSAKSSIREATSSSLFQVRSLYRGVGVILSLAVPARVIYLFVLESSRDKIRDSLNVIETRLYGGQDNKKYLLKQSLSVSMSGGLAGGLAAMCSQTIVVPMDVISQKQMVMNPMTYGNEGSAWKLTKKIINSDGLIGLYRGFGLSIFSSIPSGSIWWATYSYCQHQLPSHWAFHTGTNVDKSSTTYMAKKASMQLISGISSALVTATLTQPLDVIKTKIQVGLKEGSKYDHTPVKLSYTSVSRDLFAKSSFSGFYRGCIPRIVHMSIWGTLMSSAYEYLKDISRKDNHTISFQ